MRTRVLRLETDNGKTIAAAWFMGNTGESFIFGDKPADVSHETEEDDYQPVTGCRFMVSGSVRKVNQFREVVITETSPMPTSGNLYWCEFVILEDNTIGFCLDSFDPDEPIVQPMRLNFEPGEVKTLAVPGYLCTAGGEISINGEPVGRREIVKLTGASIEITAGINGAQVGVIEVSRSI